VVAISGEASTASSVLRLSIVVPVFQGERTLEPLLAEIEPLTKPGETPRGRRFQVAEVVLVHDGAIDDSQAVMLALASHFPFVTLVWLSRNFGQHPATLAGMSVASADWVATLDEDGQQDPAELGPMLDRALRTTSLSSTRTRSTLPPTAFSATRSAGPSSSPPALS
jgi:glycosyltransferase involved in cell wall biosynthesis